MCKEYNGYTNYETWVINLWLDNDESTQDYMIELTEQADKPYELANAIKDYIEENNPITDASVYSDLLQSAIDNCNFDEIADNYWTEYHKLSDDQEYILEHVGGTWAEVVSTFSARSEEEILEKLDCLFPDDDNTELASMIYCEL